MQYYYEEYPNGNNTNFVSALLSSLIGAISGGTAAGNLVKNNAGQISSQLSGVSGFINAVQPHGSNPTGGLPEAYLTVLFFDERFNFIPAADGGVAQLRVDDNVGSNGSSLTLANIKAPKNGYAFIYIGNQSNNDTYWDNLQVGIAQGNIAEENHYYSYGLKIATLSSKKLGDSYEGTLKNNYLYQGAYSELDDDIGWNDFALRNYDPQIGRWVQQDPYQEYASPYVGMGGDPVNLVDPSGGSILSGLSAVARVAVTTIGGAIIGGAIGLISGDDDFTGVLIGAGVGLAAGLGSLIKQISWSMGIQAMNAATSVINTSVKSEQAGRHVPSNPNLYLSCIPCLVFVVEALVESAEVVEVSETAAAIYEAYKVAKTAQTVLTLLQQLQQQVRSGKLVSIPMTITTDAQGKTVTVPDSELKEFQAKVKTERVEDIDKKIKQDEKSIRSLKKQIKEHEQKLEDFKNDPEGSTRGDLKDGKTGEEIQKLIDGRIKKLEKEIQKFKNVIKQKENNIHNLETQKKAI